MSHADTPSEGSKRGFNRGVRSRASFGVTVPVAPRSAFGVRAQEHNALRGAVPDRDRPPKKCSIGQPDRSTSRSDQARGLANAKLECEFKLHFCSARPLQGTSARIVVCVLRRAARPERKPGWKKAASSKPGERVLGLGRGLAEGAAGELDRVEPGRALPGKAADTLAAHWAAAGG